jgi:hypothetical protein
MHTSIKDRTQDLMETHQGLNHQTTSRLYKIIIIITLLCVICLRNLNYNIPSFFSKFIQMLQMFEFYSIMYIEKKLNLHELNLNSKKET